MLVYSAGNPVTSSKLGSKRGPVAVGCRKRKRRERARRPSANLGGARALAGPNKGRATRSRACSSTVCHPSSPCVSASALPLQSPVSAVGLKQAWRDEAARAPACLPSPYLGWRNCGQGHHHSSPSRPSRERFHAVVRVQSPQRGEAARRGELGH